MCKREEKEEEEGIKRRKGVCKREEKEDEEEMKRGREQKGKNNEKEKQ